MILPPRFSCWKQNKEDRLGFPLASNIWGLWEVNMGEGRRLKVAFVNLKDMCTRKEESIWEPLETTERFRILRKLGEVAQILLLLRCGRNSSEILGIFQDCQDISELHEIHCQFFQQLLAIGNNVNSSCIAVSTWDQLNRILLIYHCR